MVPVTQRLTWLVAVVVVVALLVLGGIVSIRVDLHPPRWAAAEFWTNAPKDGPLQPAFQLWVDLAKAALRAPTPERVKRWVKTTEYGETMSQILSWLDNISYGKDAAAVLGALDAVTERFEHDRAELGLFLLEAAGYDMGDVRAQVIGKRS